jgi:hypothetical protein
LAIEYGIFYENLFRQRTNCRYKYRKYMVDVGMEKVYPVSEKVYLAEL